MELDENLYAEFAGVEVISADKNVVNKIKKNISLKIGQKLRLAETEQYKNTCEQLVTKYFDIPKLKCDFIYFSDGFLYLTINIVPKRTTRISQKNNYIIYKNSLNVPNKLMFLLHKLEERQIFLINHGIPLTEKNFNNTLDFDDYILHSIAYQLRSLVPQYNNTLLMILRDSNNPFERENAAQLLSWANEPKNLPFLLANHLFYDSALGVRNNLLRSYTITMKNKVFDNYKSELLVVSCNVAMLPSHFDRNKGLVLLKTILNSNPHMIYAIRPECSRTIKLISEASVMDNVGGVAREILALSNAIKE
ncbi:MAG TPA: hypothetical protein VFP93_03680 [Gammaproteobacteria bacterium]|nr:hypothetical protein [Gammaproteobacteria bacterium]